MFASGHWFLWDGQRYLRDDTHRAWDLARRFCRTASVRCKAKRVADHVASAKTIYAVVKLGSSDRRHAVKVEDFDTDPMLLNTPVGILKLPAGNLEPHDRALRMTKMAGAAPGGEAPLWRKFLGDVTAGDEELQWYLQRFVGYSLTGSTEEHALVFLYGPGGTGKSVFLSVLMDLLGDYAASAPMDMFVVAKGERHPTELAMLHGRRLVTASETQEGRRWDEAKLKAITGGDRITARQMRQDFFTFTPAFKLFMAGNYRPAIRSVDEAMRRRLHIVPFMHRIAKPDKHLLSKLRGELGGIMKWAVQGCLDWQRDGLAPPKSVERATDDYFETEDAIGRWLADRCNLDPNTATTTRILFRDWKIWATETSEYVGSERRFAQLLQQRDFERWQHPVARTRGFRGVELLHGQGELDMDRSRPSINGKSGADAAAKDEDRWEY